MSVRKHLAGFAIFSVILGGAIFFNYLLTIPDATIAPVPLSPPPTNRADRPRPINFVVRQVALDFRNQKSYTELSLELRPDQPAPERLWVTTFYFSPDNAPGQGWSSTAEIRGPFAGRAPVTFVATAQCDLCSSSDTPRAGYFARVYVSTEYAGDAYPPDVQFNRDITDAIPVVVHWPNEKTQSADTVRKFERHSAHSFENFAR